MVTEANELKWLLLPAYPFVVVLLFGFWITRRFRNERNFMLRISLFGMKLDIGVSPVVPCPVCQDRSPHPHCPPDCDPVGGCHISRKE